MRRTFGRSCSASLCRAGESPSAAWQTNSSVKIGASSFTRSVYQSEAPVRSANPRPAQPRSRRCGPGDSWPRVADLGRAQRFFSEGTRRGRLRAGYGMRPGGVRARIELVDQLFDARNSTMSIFAMTPTISSRSTTMATLFSSKTSCTFASGASIETSP